MSEQRLIDANKIVFNYGGLAHIAPSDFVGTAKYFLDQIKAAPTIDPESLRPVGRWIDVSGGRTICKRCGNYPLYDYWGKQTLSKYCPHCGARMEEST